jgi:lipopolysaccharide transport system ATP-binding protein
VGSICVTASPTRWDTSILSTDGPSAHGADSSANRPLPSVHSSQPLALGTPHALERDFWALKNVSFEIKQGESVGFIGRNGAGKSTILKLLAGVTKASSGTAEVNGKVAALIEVGAGFHPELTGRENVFLNGSILGLKKAEIEKAFDSIVALLS